MTMIDAQAVLGDMANIAVGIIRVVPKNAEKFMLARPLS